MKSINNNQGTILLLALMVMAGIMTVSIGTATLIISEVKQSLQLDQSIIAFYAAESGSERGLYQARAQNFDPAAIGQLNVELENNASYQLVATDTEPVLYKNLAQDETYQVDLYDPHSLGVLTNPIKAISLEWAGGSSWLEVNWSCWNTNGALGEPKSAYLAQGEIAFIDLFDAADCYLYRLRIMARHGDANSIQLKAYSEVDPVQTCNGAENCRAPLPARVQIKAVGKYPSNSSAPSRQAILVTMPEKPPLSGLYDYVLYSEEEVKKEN